MSQQKKKAPKGAKASDTVVGLLDTHLKCVVDALIGEGAVDSTDFATITTASGKFMNGVASELLEVELTPLLNLIRPDRYNAARNRRNGKGNGNGKGHEAVRRKPPSLLEYEPHPGDQYLQSAADLFEDEIDF